MSLVFPFAGLRPVSRYAADVAAPPYDVLDSDEARELARGRPLSFLHISKPEIDLPPETDPYSPAVYARGADNFRRMLDDGVLKRDPAPGFYLYRAVMGEHSQTGVVAAASVDAYEQGDIRRHEFTRPQKEDDRVRQIDSLNAQTGPVFLTYRHRDDVDRLVQGYSARDPEFTITAEGGVQHSLWVINDPAEVAELSAALGAVERFYIADGHHRSAAAARVAHKRRHSDPSARPEAPYNYFLSVIFPDDQVQILDYNRVVKDLNGLSPEQFLEQVGKNFSVQKVDGPLHPGRHGEVGMYLPGQWYRLQINDTLISRDDPVASLDVSLLADHLVAPVLGITDPRRDARIDFVGGIRGLKELERRVDNGNMAVAFAMHPTQLDELMAVADAGQVMPPKSTWFEPKLADGLVTHLLD